MFEEINLVEEGNFDKKNLIDLIKILSTPHLFKNKFACFLNKTALVATLKILYRGQRTFFLK